MKRSIVITAVLIQALLLPGCGVGLIYTHTVEPLNPNMHRTEMALTSGQGDVKQIAIQGISVTWNDNAIGDIAREKGLTELYYADREILSVVFGIWKQETIHVYGR
jgi:hypothetical protein